MRFYRFFFSLQKQSNNWLKNRKNSEFVVSEMAVGFDEQDSKTKLWLLHSCYLFRICTCTLFDQFCKFCFIDKKMKWVEYTKIIIDKLDR